MPELLSQQHRMLIVISSPSGGGKTTLTRALLGADPSLAYSVSTTTRAPRPGEVEGRDYHFVSRDEFQRLIEQEQFLEWAEVHGNLYGTRRDTVKQLLDSDRDVVLDVDVQGAMSLRRCSADAVLLFLMPLSIKVLEERLLGRAQDSEEVIARRLRDAREEMRAAPQFDYLVVNDRLEDALATIRAIIAAERCRATRRLSARDLKWAAEIGGEPPRAAASFAPAIVFASRVMGELLDRAERAARTDSSVLLLGETGTGKEILAEAIHRASRRATGPLVRINCGAFPPMLLESELFGHMAGAFTGAVRNHAGLFRAADRGTILLDEIGELSLDLQVKLLRVLQDGEVRPVGGTQPLHVDVRAIAATNRDLAAAVAAGRFREDLFYRLNVVPLRLPPLRERREDIPILVSHFLRRTASADQPPKSVAPEALDLLVNFDWPGNVRQLENAIEHAVVLSQSDELRPDDFPESIRRAKIASASRPVSETGADTLEELEIAAIRRALERSGHNLTRAARALAITRRALTYRLYKYDIQVERRRGRPRREWNGQRLK
jgi:guanylate kinase